MLECETHPLIHRTYPIIASPLSELWQVHTHCGIQHMLLCYQLVGKRVESVLGVHEYRRGLNAGSLDE